jgi:hypothetical protein
MVPIHRSMSVGTGFSAELLLFTVLLRHQLSILFFFSPVCFLFPRFIGTTRGEFQYKEVKIPADRMIANVGQFIPEGQLLFIATDERNKTFFDPFLKRFPHIKYLDDFMDFAELKNINPNFLGMIDQVICTRGDVFVGTWFSTFTGYITRMRGYLGYEDTSVFFGDKAHR